MPDWFDVFYIDKHSASAGKRVGFDREIFWKSGVSLSKHIVVEYIDREAGKKGRRKGMMGMVQKRRMASATAGRATSSPSNGRRRNDGQALSCRRNVCGVRDGKGERDSRAPIPATGRR